MPKLHRLETLQQPNLSPNPRQQMMGIISSSSTRATPTSSTATLTQTIRQSVEIWNSDSSYADLNGSFVSLGAGGSPAMMSWPLSEESKVCRVDAVILSTSECSLKQAEDNPPSRYRLCEPTNAMAASTRICDQYVSSNDAVTDIVFGVGVAAETPSVAVTSAGPASQADRRRPALRIQLQDRPEFHANTGTVDAVLDDDANSDDEDKYEHLLSFFPTPPEAEKLEPSGSNAATHAADLARLSRCLICQPPRVRPVPSSIIGVEISLIGSTTTTGTNSTSNDNNGSSSVSSCSCSAHSSPDTLANKNNTEPVSSGEEVDLPSSEPLPALLTGSAATRGFGGSMQFATASTAVVEVVESTLAHQHQRDEGSEDICSTCTCTDTGCSSDSEETSQPVAPLRIGSSTPDRTNSDVAPQQMQLVLQAVNSAIERINWE
ncbi:hypothetical protein BOX15_Mlig004133g1 [Macrostomum lignano]|uniref:Uncharacterized protein n=1 Tax=Macrostomum lignano TaxID=282301 RepID=A0A267F2M7_9PLAT|nr:hypothetical protein BOX15_Mlig004133g1 [Macrostomum lignano]